MRFRKKPIEVDAEEWKVGEAAPRGVCGCGACPTAHVHTAQGAEVHVAPGEWIVAESNGHGFYPVAGDIFATSFDAVPMGGFLPEQQVSLGVVKGLENELAQARKAWTAEVRALRDGRRERLAGRVLASLMASERWLGDPDGPPPDVDERIDRIERLANLAAVAADVQVVILERVPPLSVPTDRVR